MLPLVSPFLFLGSAVLMRGIAAVGTILRAVWRVLWKEHDRFENDRLRWNYGLG